MTRAQSILAAVHERREMYPWKAQARRLTRDEIDLMEDFVLENGALDQGEFERAINRMFLDKPKPRGWLIILDLLSCANSAVGRAERKAAGVQP